GRLGEIDPARASPARTVLSGYSHPSDPWRPRTGHSRRIGTGTPSWRHHALGRQSFEVLRLIPRTPSTSAVGVHPPHPTTYSIDRTCHGLTTRALHHFPYREPATVFAFQQTQHPRPLLVPEPSTAQLTLMSLVWPS